MPRPALALQPDVVTTVFRALCTVLQSDPVLGGQGVVRTWRTWTGDAKEAQPPATAEMPWVRLTPKNSPLTIGEEAAWYCDFTIRYELATAGTSFDDIANLVGALRNAVAFDRIVQTTTALEYLRRAGAVIYTFTEAAYGMIHQPPLDPQSIAPPPTDWAAAGTFVVRRVIPA
jgi:hypothetical protein